MASEQYCLRWNDHRTILLTNFERLLQSNSSVDCTLAAEGQCLRAHKVVLSACSPYFELMLNQDKEKHPIIFLKDMKFKELQAILEYMYRGEVVIPHDQLTSLLQAAESLQIKGLGCGEKSQPQSVNRSLIQTPKQPQPQQPKQQLQQPLQQVVQKPVQPVRQSVPTIRGLEVTQVIHESAPQVVDLTDEPRARVNTSPAAHHVQESAKRSMPQNSARAKRVPYPAVTSERFNLNNRTTLSPTNLQNIYQQQNLTVTNTGQSGGTSMIATTAPVASVVSNSPNTNPAIHRQTNESAGHNAVQVLMPPTQRPETHDIRDSGNQPVTYKPKPRAISVQRRLNLGNVVVQTSPGNVVMQTNPGPSTSPVALPSQNAVIAVGPKVSTPTTESNTVGRAVINENVADKADNNATATSLPEVQQTNGSTNQIYKASDPKHQDPIVESVVEPAEEADPKEPSPEKEKEPSPPKDPALDKPGPSGAGKVKPGRRGRTPASERRFQCPECDKRFTQKTYLENHLRIHDGECYECDNCTKTFLTRATLLKHLRAHAAKATNNTPQKCQLCGATFPNATDLEKHLTDHTISGADDN